MTVGYRLDFGHLQQLGTGPDFLNGARLRVLANNTTTPLSLYSDRACLVSAANPVVADSEGRLPVRYIATPALMTWALYDASDVSYSDAIWSDDDIDAYVSALALGSTVNDTVGWFNVTDTAYGATGDGTTDDAAAIYSAIAAAISAGGGVVYFPPGVYRIKTDITQITVAAEQKIRLLGAGKDITRLRFSNSVTRGIKYRSTTVTANRLPRFAVEGMTLAASAEKLDWAIDAEWATAADIEQPFFMEDVSITQWLDDVADDGSDYGYFQNLVRVSNARNSSIHKCRFSGEADRATAGDRSQYGVKLEGECTDFKFSDIQISECVTGAYITGTTEGVYFSQTDITYCRDGINYDIASGAEPQFTFTDGHINAYRRCVKLKNVQQSALDNFLFYGSATHGQQTQENFVAIEILGSNSAYININGIISKEGGHGSSAETSTGILVTAGSRITVAPSTFIFSAESGNPFTKGVELTTTDATLCNVSCRTRNVTSDYVFAAADGHNIVRQNSGEPQFMGAANQFLTILGTAAAYLKMYDSGAGADLKEGRLLWNDGTLQIIGVNDNGTTKWTALTFFSNGNIGPGSDNAVSLGQNSLEFSNVSTRQVKVSGNVVVNGRKTGWSVDAGTAKRTANTTYDAATISNPPTQAEVQALANALQDVSRTQKALKDDLHQTAGHGLIGT